METEERGDGEEQLTGAGVDSVCLHGYRKLWPGDGAAQHGGQGTSHALDWLCRLCSVGRKLPMFTE